jgi:hypothetical protein
MGSRTGGTKRKDAGKDRRIVMAANASLAAITGPSCRSTSNSNEML